MDRPISQIIPEAEEEEPESLFMQLTSQLSLAEMLAVFQGNFGAVQGMNRKFKKVLLDKKLKGEDTPAKRKQLIDSEGEKLKNLLFVPDAVKPNIFDGFEPLLVAGDLVDTHFARILDLILDFDDQTRPDSEFIEEMKDALTYFIGELIDELQDGFQNGMQDTVVFLRENIINLIKEGTGPEMSMMVGMLGTDTVMGLITRNYQRYREKKTELKAGYKAYVEAKKAGKKVVTQATATPKQQEEDVKMREEEKDETPEGKRARFLNKWSSVINQDVQQMTQHPPVQRPLSRAYLSICPVAKSQNKQAQDEKNQSIDYLSNKVGDKEAHVRARVRANLMSSGFPQAKVDEVMGTIEKLPDSLVSSYYEMIREDLKNRIQNDPDYRDKKRQNGSTPYNYLDQL